MTLQRLSCAGGSLVLSLALTLAAQAEQIQRVVDINPGPGSGGASFLTIYNDALYFRANNLVAGNNCELWRYDGASASLAAEINPSPTAGSDPTDLVVYGGKLTFAATNGVGAQKLWQFDGTNAAQAPAFPPTAQTPQDMFPFGGNLYYRASQFSSPNIGTELWKFDGTSHTAMDLFSGPGSSGPQHFVEYNGRMYFNACGAVGEGSELWRLNAAANGAELAASIYPHNGSSPEWPVVFNGKLYFSARDGVHGQELWQYDGTNATIAADICPGGASSSSNPSGMTVYNGAVYFSANSGDGVSGYELWRFDGTSASKVAEINPTPDPGNGDTFLMDSSPANFTVFKGVLYFSATDGLEGANAHGRELWRYDGTNVSMVEDFYPGTQGSDPSGLTVWGDTLFFQANNGTAGGELSGVTEAEAVWALTVPEPATLALLAMGAVALLRRRR
jgi:ELWxxDGT repeat protein